MSRQFPSEELLAKVIIDLDDFLPYLVLVGGWIPYLYAKYIWPENIREKAAKNTALPFSPQAVITTTDLDFGVMVTPYSGDESIAERIQKLGYAQRHVSMDRPFPFVPVVKGRGENEKAEVEFITVLDPPENLREKLVGKQIKLNTIPYFGILLKSPITVKLFSCKVQLPTESTFIFHKLLTFVERDNKEKLKKDLYYSYYMLRYSPDKDALISQIQGFLRGKKEGEMAVNNIKQYFKIEDDKGPVLIEQENGPDNFISNIRKDAFERITKLLSKR